MTPFRLVIIASVAALTLVADPHAARAQTFETLHYFVEPPSEPHIGFSDPDGSVYGWFRDGGPKHGGGIFRSAPDGAFTVLYAFDSANPHGLGYWPNGLVRGADGALYGTTGDGFPTDAGTLFRLVDGTVTVLHTFRDRRASGALAVGTDGLLYGSTNGPSCGTLFSFDPISRVMTTMHAFACSGVSGRSPGPFFIEPDGSILGLAHAGGASGYGTIYRWNSSGVTDLYHFDRTVGAGQTLIKGSDGAWYGTTCCALAAPIIFKFVAGATASSSTFAALHAFAQGTVSRGIVSGADGALYGVDYAHLQPGRVFKWQAGAISELHTFNVVDGEQPIGPLVIASDGKIVGATLTGGRSRANGTVFSVETDGTHFTSYSLEHGGAMHPSGPLVRMPDGMIYGTTIGGGSFNGGTLYRRDPSGNIAVVHEFAPTDGVRPTGVVRAANGKWYGTTAFGGAHGGGTIFEWDGTTLAVVHSFDWFVEPPAPAALIAARDGSLYGTTTKGGDYNGGTIFRWSDGTFTVLHHFTYSTGFEPHAAVSEGDDGAIYGVATRGGPAFLGVVFKWADGAYSVLHSFTSPEGGFAPDGPVVQGADGSIFGTTRSGGAYNAGTLFKLKNGAFSVLHSFSIDQGAYPRLPLVRLADGSIVGVTSPVSNGQRYYNHGSIFRWNGQSLSILHRFEVADAVWPSGLTLASDGNVYGSTERGGLNGGGTLFRVVFNPAPVITNVTAPLAPLAVNTPVSITASFVDGELTGHTCAFAWGDGAVSTSTPETPGTCSASRLFSAAGVYTVTVTVTDAFGVSDREPSPFVVIYDASAGFVTGNGWIQSAPGAYAADPSLEGRANFAFVSRFHKGASVPAGNTEFQFHAGSMAFASTNYEWLVVSGARAQFKGRGTVNGAGDYGFLLTAIDGRLPGGGGTDAFRIKIWDRANATVIYDNVAGAGDNFDGASVQAIGAGSIVIHAK